HGPPSRGPFLGRKTCQRLGRHAFLPWRKSTTAFTLQFNWAAATWGNDICTVRVCRVDQSSIGEQRAFALYTDARKICSFPGIPASVCGDHLPYPRPLAAPFFSFHSMPWPWASAGILAQKRGRHLRDAIVKWMLAVMSGDRDTKSEGGRAPGDGH